MAAIEAKLPPGAQELKSGSIGAQNWGQGLGFRVILGLFWGLY